MIKFKRSISFFVIISCISVAYFNSLNCDWHLDDLPNITANKPLHLSDLSYLSLNKAMYASPEGSGENFYRPVPMLTLAINWYFGQDDVFGYHLVNIFIHILTALFLYFFLMNLALAANAPIFFQKNRSFIALLATLLWALNPIQTQAVTYIIQRMASLAAMFYLLAMLLFVLGRLASSYKYRGTYFLGCFLCFFLAIASKENAITLPLALLLIEVVFFTQFKSGKERKIFFILVFSMAAFCLLAGSYLFLKGDFFSILSGYEDRSFTLRERLLAEPRIVVLYLSQLLYPIPNRLSLTHDIIVSESFISPWTTIPSLTILVILIGIGFTTIYKNKLLSFSILFFFLNHIIESSVVPLELIFEHRNYLPSLFVFLPIAGFIKYGLDYYQQRRTILFRLLQFFTVFLVIMLISGTAIRNMVWLTEESLWSDSLTKAPKSARAAHNLARCYRDKGNFEEAKVLFERALFLSPQSAEPIYTKVSALNGLSTIYILTGSLQKGLSLLQEALEIDESFEASRKNIIITYLKIEEFTKAEDIAVKLIDDYPQNAEYHYLAGISMFRQGKFSESLELLQEAFRLNPSEFHIVMGLATILKNLNYYDKAKSLYSLSYKIDKNQLLPLIALLEIAVIHNEKPEINKILSEISREFSKEDIDMVFRQNAQKNLLYNVFSENIVRNLL